MAQSNGISGGIKPNFVSAGMFAGAIGAHADGPRVAAFTYGIYELQQSSGRSIFLSVVMDFPGPGAIFRLRPKKFRGQAGEFAKHGNADREIRAPYQAGARGSNGRTHSFKAVEPAC